MAATTQRYANEQANTLLRRLSVEIHRTIKQAGEDEVHDLRVAIRRFGCVLKVLKCCFPEKETKKIRRGLKKIMTRAGDVRNCDIAQSLLAKLAPRSSSALVDHFHAEREEAARILSVSLNNWVRREMSARWHGVVQGQPPSDESEDFRTSPARASARRILPEMATEHFNRGEKAARSKALPDELHRFRIATKHLRYTVDLFAPLYGSSVKGMVEELKDVQTILGDINDCETVRHMASRADAAKPILAALKRRQDKKTRQYRKCWKKDLASGDALKRWTDVLDSAGKRASAA